MRTSTLLRWAALAAVMGFMAPVPAEAQIGRFLKKKLKQAIVQTAIAQAAPEASPAAVDSAAYAMAPGATSVPAAGAPRARKGMPGKPSIFSESTLEMTAELLDRFDRAVAAEQAEKKLVAPKLARLLNNHDYQKCLRVKALALPEGQKAQREYLTALQSGKAELYQAAMEKMTDELERISEPVCGPSPRNADELRRQLEEQPQLAGLKVSGLEQYQYYILKERIVPFCALLGTLEAAGELMRLNGRNGAGYVYSQVEVAALRPRCARLAAALK